MEVISITIWENPTCTENFRGLKYKSDNYQLCQACFWCGHIDSEHKNDVFKEYNSHKTSGNYVNNMMQGRLKIWTEHLHWLLLNWKPLKIS